MSPIHISRKCQGKTSIPCKIDLVKELKQNTAINLKKVDKGNTTVILNITDKLQGLIQRNNRDHYLPLEKPMVVETLQKAKELISQLHNDMT